MFETIAPHTIWFGLGLLGLIAEIMSGGFWMFFMGIAAILTGILTYAGFLETTELRLAVFAASTLLLVLTLRKPLVCMMSKSKVGPAVKDAVGETVTVVRDITPDMPGQVEYQGAPWTALSADNLIHPAGQNVKIVRQDGMKYHVTKV